MTDTSGLLNDLAVMLCDTPDLAAEMGGDPERSYVVPAATAENFSPRRHSRGWIQRRGSRLVLERRALITAVAKCGVDGISEQAFRAARLDSAEQAVDPER